MDTDKIDDQFEVTVRACDLLFSMHSNKIDSISFTTDNDLRVTIERIKECGDDE